MKRYLAIFGFVFIGVIAGLIVRGIPIVLHVNAGGGIQADRNGDVNGDARLDMSDAVYLLLHIFRDGPQPVAFAQGIPGEWEGPLADIADSLAYESLKNRHDRFVDHGNSTVTDRLTGRMWANTDHSGNWETVQAIISESSHAGHTDWRLPTGMELLSIRRRAMPLNLTRWSGSTPTGFHQSESSTLLYLEKTFIGGTPQSLWSSIESGANAFVFNVSGSASASTSTVAGRRQDRFVLKSNNHQFFMVRDISPNE